MARRKHQANPPWYRSSAAILLSGGLGIALLAALVLAVVHLSDDWSRAQTTVLTTPETVAPNTESRDSQPFVITPSSSSTTSFTTSVSVSTTDIGLPGDTASSDTTTSGTSSDSSATSGSESGTSETTTTSRARPRFNQTHTAVPGH